MTEAVLDFDLPEEAVATDRPLVYTPPPSLVPFFTSEQLANFVVGPVGSCKTAAGIMKIAYQAKKIAPCRDGVRRTRYAWIRNTREMLSDTSIPDFLNWFPDGVAGVYLKSERRYLLRFDDVECEVIFRGLDDADDVRRLLSMQLTGAIMDEFREINPQVYKGLASRIGRYPNKGMNGVGCRTSTNEPMKRIWGMSNPPDYGTFWEDLLNNPPENVHVSIQPSGVSPEADWLQYLDEGYYDDLLELHANDQDWIDVYVHAKFGASLAGKPVFRTFSQERHVAKEALNVIPATPLLIAFDPGVACTAAVLGQATFDGRVLVHDAIHSLGMGAARFCDEKLKPLLAAKYANRTALVIMDPAGRQRASADENTAARVLRSKGFRVVFAATNALTARISAVEAFLNRTPNGNQGLLIAPHNKELIQAIGGKYRFKVKKNGDTEDEPEKLHPISDLVDCLEYLCMHADGGETLGRKLRIAPLAVKHISPAGWT